jgi:hypothetical protein
VPEKPRRRKSTTPIDARTEENAASPPVEADALLPVDGQGSVPRAAKTVAKPKPPAKPRTTVKPAATAKTKVRATPKATAAKPRKAAPRTTGASTPAPAAAPDAGPKRKAGVKPTP